MLNDLCSGEATYAAVAVTAPQTGAGIIQLVGDTTTPGNVVISSNTGHAIFVSGASLYVAGFKLTAGGAGLSDIYVSGRGFVSVIGKMEYGASSTWHVSVYDQSLFVNNGFEEVVSGDAPGHIFVFGLSKATLNAITWTFVGARTFSSAFVYASDLSALSSLSCTSSGTVPTTAKYVSGNNSIIQTNGAGESYFPGTAAGVKVGGGLYS